MALNYNVFSIKLCHLDLRKMLPKVSVLCQIIQMLTFTTTGILTYLISFTFHFIQRILLYRNTVISVRLNTF